MTENINTIKQIKKTWNKKVWIFTILFSIIVIWWALVFLYFKITQSYIYSDDVTIDAPSISLWPVNSWILKELYVNVWDEINENAKIALVDNEIIKSKTNWIITSTIDNVWKIFTKWEAVATMINPDDLRVVAKIDEDKWLKDIKVWQYAVFQVDAFWSKKFDWIVDEISPVSDESDVVFNISDRREEQQFDVKIRFDTNKYPQLKSWMSARVRIYK